MGDIKEKTSDVVYSYYKKTKDLKKTIQVCKSMLESKNSNPLIRGELAEILLIIMLEEFIEVNKLQDRGWVISKGLILKDVDNPTSGYTTELDVTLFTPKQIYMFECKSYKGHKILIDKCKLLVKTKSRTRSTTDVYGQHIKHYKALFKYIHPFMVKVNSKYKPFKIVFFNFSIGDLEDKREDSYKSLFPVYDETNLYKMFTTYKDMPIQWDMNYISKVVKKLENTKKTLTSTHIDYVRSLHGN